MRNLLVFILLNIINLNAYSQKSRYEIGYSVTTTLMKKISPNTGKNSTTEILPGTKNFFKVISTWQAGRTIFSDIEVFECRSMIEIDDYNNLLKVDVFYKNDAVKNAWSSSDVTTALAGIVVTGAAINKYSSSSSSSSSGSLQKSYSSGSTSSSSNSNSSLPSKSKCSSCNGRGICTECAGKGSYYCDWCKGKGTKLNFLIEEKCSWCNATGVKYCTNCNGKGVCRSCNGKGEY